ncbi:MAG TPA: hypothetical protein VGI54_07250 [Solirubrobacteraceae bacterium]
MTSDGRPYPRFRRALDTGDYTIIRAAAAELPQIGLGDALRICWAIRHTATDVYPRACLRWLARFCREAEGVELNDVATAARALHAILAGGAERPAREELEALCARFKLGRL